MGDKKVYMIIDIEVRDEALYGQYVDKVTPVISDYGGRYLTRGGKVTSFDGIWRPSRLVIIEFPSYAAWKSCFTSRRYKTIASLREESTTSRAVLAEGI